MPHLELTLIQWIILGFCGILIGATKAGLSGIGLAVVPIMAVIFGGRVSTGILLPMLIIADIFAVRHYHQHAEWKHVARLMPWAVIGIIIALIVGNQVSDILFKRIMAVTVLVSVTVMIARDLKKNATVPDTWWFSLILGLAGGFATMIGNAAGPIMALYLLTMHLPKMNFIGTGAWFFFIVNIIKVPLHVFVWKTITLQSVLFNLIMAPAIIAGVFLGIWIVRKIPEKVYRILVIAATILSASLLLR